MEFEYEFWKWASVGLLLLGGAVLALRSWLDLRGEPRPTAVDNRRIDMRRLWAIRAESNRLRAVEEQLREVSNFS